MSLEDQGANVEIAVVGLGRMGSGIARRLLAAGHRVVVTNRSAAPVEELSAEGAVGVLARSDAVAALDAPRVVWLMLPAGEATEEAVSEFVGLLEPGDVLVDGGNSFYKDTLRRAAVLAQVGVGYVDVGVSGGIWGTRDGFCLMVGGAPAAVQMLTPVLESLAPTPVQGWAHVGGQGAGHFAKMVHNGIEYGLMQAYAEGFDLIQARSDLGLEVNRVTEVWRHGSVVRSWLLDLAAEALADDPSLAGVAAYVEDSGEGRWTVEEAIAQNVAAPVITMSLLARLSSRRPESYAAKVLAVLRNRFGGHSLPTTTM